MVAGAESKRRAAEATWVREIWPVAILIAPPYFHLVSHRLFPWPEISPGLGFLDLAWAFMAAFGKIVLFFLDVTPLYLLIAVLGSSVFLLLMTASRRLASTVATITHPLVCGVFVRPLGAALTIGASLAGILCFGQACLLLFGRLEVFSFLAETSSRLSLLENVGLLVLSPVVTLAGLVVFRALWCDTRPCPEGSDSLQSGLFAGSISLYLTLVRLYLLPRWSDVESLELRLAHWAWEATDGIPRGLYVVLFSAAGCTLIGFLGGAWRSIFSPTLHLTPGLSLVATACGLQYILLYSVIGLRFVYLGALFAIAVGLSLIIVIFVLINWIEKAQDLPLAKLPRPEPPMLKPKPPEDLPVIH